MFKKILLQIVDRDRLASVKDSASRGAHCFYKGAFFLVTWSIPCRFNFSPFRITLLPIQLCD